MQIVRQSSLQPVPWRNGAGTTREMVRTPISRVSPPQAPLLDDAFLWRVSIADVQSSGPFSDFAGYVRIMVLLQGMGVRLDFGDGRSSDLERVGDWVQFDGGCATHARLIDGPCTDLNLIVANHLGVRAWVQHVPGPVELGSGSNQHLLAIPVTGGIQAEVNETVSRLEPWDLAIFAPGECGSAGPVGQSEVPLVFFAALDDRPR